MKKTFHGLLAGVLLIACDSGKQIERSQSDLPRIAIAGLAIESSTFSPARTHEEAFHPRTGDEILDVYRARAGVETAEPSVVARARLEIHLATAIDDGELIVVGIVAIWLAPMLYGF